MKSKLPKLSYVLLSHNREKYIRQAIESAFAQVYEGELEYIFSDDCSTDSTFEIIKQCVAEYKGGRKIIVTQTPHNMHLAGNTNHAVQFATGEYVVRADDDDISTIDRCSIIGNIIAQYPGCSAVQTKFRNFTDSEEKQILQDAVKLNFDNNILTFFDISKGYDGTPGLYDDFTSIKVWSIDVYRKFSPLPLSGYYVDDLICHYRANVLGYCVRTSEVTVMVRKGIDNMCNGGINRAESYSSTIALEKFNDKYMNITYEPLESTIKEIFAYLKANRPEVYSISDNFLNAMRQELQKRNLQRSFWRKGIINRIRITHKLGKWSLFSVCRCLPMPVFAFILTVFRKLRSLVRFS